MREFKKRLAFISIMLLILLVTGCGNSRQDNNTTTTAINYNHQEVEMTAVITKIDLEYNMIDFVDCSSGDKKQLIYNGGVNITNSFGNSMNISEIVCGEVMDITYYEDNLKLTQMTSSDKVTKRENITKFTIDMDKHKAVYKGVSLDVADYVTAFDEGIEINPMEIGTEDELTLNIYGNQLVSIVIGKGHGYVTLTNQSTYIGGMVEIGKDVIVPVTSNMLLEVREGTYTLRVSKDSYSDSKDNIVVKKGEKTIVDLSDIAIPTGTANFDIIPAEAKLYVNGVLRESHTYTDLYGSYGIKIEADGYNTFNGRVTISNPVKVYDIELTKSEDATEATTEAENGSITSSTNQTTTESTTANGSGTTTEEEKATNNKIIINSPADVGVYLDGEYVGVAPVEVAKTVGTHAITLYKKGYLIKSYSIISTDDGMDDSYSFADLVPVSETTENTDS